MTSPATIRDPVEDHMFTPENAALVIIDFQPVQVASIVTMERRQLVANVVSVARAAKLYGVPIVLSTVNVKTGRNQPTIHQLTEVLADIIPIDRTSINAWEDVEFAEAVRATGRRKLIMVALWTEVCLVFPVLDALKEGFDVYPVVDAVAGTSQAAHDAGLDRIMQAGAKPISWIQLASELQRIGRGKRPYPALARSFSRQSTRDNQRVFKTIRFGRLPCLQFCY